MSERKIIKQVSVDAKIYDRSLGEKTVNMIHEDITRLREEPCLSVDVVFNRGVYRDAVFFQYPVSKEIKGQQPGNERERLKQKIYDVLSEQLDRVTNALEQAGLRFGHTSVIGDDTDGDSVQIILYRAAQIENSVRGKQTFARTTSVMPDRPYILEQASRAFAEIVLKQIQEESLKEIAKRNHVPNWVKADRLFSAVAAGLAIPNAAGVAASANKMLGEAVIESDWPLCMKSKNREECTEPLTGDTQIDCPEYLLFRLNHGESWDMKKVENIKEAQQFISKQGFRSKQTKAIVVLHKLEPMPYVLFAETEEGLVLVSQAEAHKHKRIHLSWKSGGHNAIN